MTSDNASNNDTAMREVARAIDEDGNHWLAGPHCICCQEHILNLAARHFIDAVAPTSQATILKKIHHTINSDDIDGLTKQLSVLEHDPEAIAEDGFDASDAVGKALALIKQVKFSFNCLCLQVLTQLVN